MLYTFLISIVLTISHAEDFRSGDVIFHTSTTPQSKAIRLATNSRFSHVGIVEVIGNNAWVIEAHDGVERTRLNTWLARGEGQYYALYRYPGLTPLQGQQVVLAAKQYLGRDYDDVFSLTNYAIYCSELVWLAFKAINLDVGTKQKIGTLNVHNNPVEKVLKDRWKHHPLCAGRVRDKDACWQLIQNDDIVTPKSLTWSLQKVVSTYPWFTLLTL